MYNIGDMHLKLYNVNGRYSFEVGGFSSLQHHASVDFVRPTYEYAWKAYRDAKKLFKERDKYKLETFAVAENYWLSEETTDPKILTEILRRGNEDWSSKNAAANPNCPPEILEEVLKRGNDDDVSQAAAQNPSCPPEMLIEILRRGSNDNVSWAAARNTNCPPEILAEVLKRGKYNNVSWQAAKNQNCPIDAKIKWMRDTGRIDKEDPTRHIIEEVAEQKDDEDLRKLKELVGKNFKMYKAARDKDLYTSDIAYSTKDPKILTEILREGKDDPVSQNAAGNKNCPPEMLAEILRRGKNDWVSDLAAQNKNCPPEMLTEILRLRHDNVAYYAVRNPNCPPEMLAEILRRGNDDWISQNAAANPNCPPEVLVEVLERVRNKEEEEENVFLQNSAYNISENAAQNPNCPIDAKIKWMKDNGKIATEDPLKHKIEEIPEQKDDSLEQLKGLVSAKKWFMKKEAAEDFIKPVPIDETPEAQLIEQYENVMVSIGQQCKGIEDNLPKERKMVYEQIKKIVGELLTFKENIKKDEYKDKVDAIINKFRGIANEHFPEMLSKDKAKKEKEKKEMEAQPNELSGMLAGTSQPPPIGPEAGTSQPPVAPPAPIQATASFTKEEDPFSEQDVSEIMDHYGEQACSAVAKHHPDVIYKSDPKNKAIKIVRVEDDEKAILRIEMDDSLNVSDIFPDGDLSSLYPLSSVHFYQRYWKPIVESLGHIFLKELGVLISPKISSLPDMPNQFPSKCKMKGWDVANVKERPIELSFGGEDPTWVFANAKDSIVKMSAVNDEMEFLKSQPARVRCIDNKIVSLLNKVGMVQEIYEIPNGIGFELYIDFGRKRVWLSRDQVEIVNEV